ncbi:hypothetical protein GOP47_0005997 [Adiantum capillus-veneris]|uniref:Uncharacterized protein n=1 Tax=Adiantum capillus-veneris TaxID=13818 RepID=A0A9D4ZM52_ADICA|nr:hypothetical protein GOP47_0005997 [Adiantum capillus-veneris]
MVDSTDDEPILGTSSSPSPRKRFSPRKYPTDLTTASSSSQPYPIVNGVLKISDHSIGVAGAKSILRAARDYSHLTELDLTGCSISKGDELAETIRNSPNLRRLVLEWNNLGLAKTGIAALSSAIASSRTLKEVDLRSNRIGPTMAAALAHALRNNCSLTSLDLRWNEIGASGATALIGMLERNRVLTELQLAGNSVPSSLQAEIDRFLERNRAGVLEEDNLGVVSHCHRSSLDSLQGDDTYQEGRRAHLQYDLSKLRDNLEMLKEECQSLQLQQDSTNNQLEEIAVLQNKFFQDVSAQSGVLKEAREMHAVAMNQCEALQDEILRLREEHSSELRDLADRAGKEADYNHSLMNKMDNTLHEHDHLYMEEINKLHMRLSEESQEKEDALREIERQRLLALTAEENWLREKDAHEQALKNIAALTSEMHSLQIETEKLMKQLSRVKKSHAGELEELEKIIMYHKEIATRADQEKLDFTAERYKEDRRTWEQEAQNARHIAGINEQRLQELQSEQEQRRLEQEKKLQEAETVLSKAVQQQFGRPLVDVGLTLVQEGFQVRESRCTDCRLSTTLVHCICHSNRKWPFSGNGISFGVPVPVSRSCCKEPRVPCSHKACQGASSLF